MGTENKFYLNFLNYSNPPKKCKQAMNKCGRKTQKLNRLRCSNFQLGFRILRPIF